MLGHKEFSRRIKNKYPEYKDIDDLELANKIVKKYPEYKDIVQLEGDKMPPMDIDAMLETVQKAAKAAPYATIPFGPLVSAPVTGISRAVEGLASGEETIPQALKQGLKAGAIDASTFGLGKLYKAGRAARAATKAKGIARTPFESAEDVLKANKELFSGKNRIPTKSLEDPRYVNEVGDATAKSVNSLKNTIVSKQQKAVSEGKLSEGLPKRMYSLLGEIDLDPPVTNKAAYNRILDTLSEENMTVQKLYNARRMADEAINYNDAKIAQKPFTLIRRKIDSILKDPNYNTKARDYTKETRNLQVLTESKAIKNLARKTDPERGAGKFGESFISSGPATQRNFRKAIKNIKVGKGTQEGLKRDIIEGTDALQTSKAFRDIKPPAIIGKIPYLGDLLSRGYKSTLPAQQRFGYMAPRAGSKFLASSSAFTPIKVENEEKMNELKAQRGLLPQQRRI